MSQPPLPGAPPPSGGTGSWPDFIPRQMTPLSPQSSFDSDHAFEAGSTLSELPTAVSTLLSPYPRPESFVDSAMGPPIAIPTELPPPAIDSSPKKRKRKAASSTVGTTNSASDRSTIRKQNVEARLSALETLADACEAPPPTMRAPPSKELKTRASDARDIWYHQYPIKSKPVRLLTRSEIDILIPKVKEYQASLIFDQIQHPSPDFEAFLCACCLFDGLTKSFLNRGAGITRGIRDHMKAAHPVEYYAKCMEEGLHERCKDMPTQLSGMPEKFTLDKALDLLVRWVVVDDQAFHVTEVPEFRDFVLYIARGCLKDSDLPHRDKLESLVSTMYQKEKDSIDREMQASRGLISLTSDLWSDIRIRSFMSVTAHYINQLGVLRDHLIAFRKLDGHHTGINIAHALHDVLQESGISHKLGYITLDNASNNHAAMVDLAERLKPYGVAFDSNKNRIHCFPHIINLTVQAMIKAIPDSAAHYEASMRNSNHAIDPETAKYLEALKSQPVGLCRVSVAACRCSGTRREKFESIIKSGNELGLFRLPNGQKIQIPLNQLLRDAATRWGSTLLMMERYEQMYLAIIRFALEMRHEAIIPILDDKQFEVMQDIITILRVPQNAQELLSAEKTPTLALTMPLYENIIWQWEVLATEIPELEHAIKCGIYKLQEYIGFIDDVPVHTLAKFINPSVKFTYLAGTGDGRSLDEQEATEVITAAMMEIQRTRPLPRGARSAISARRAARAQNSGYHRVLNTSVSLRRASNRCNESPEPVVAAPVTPNPPFTSSNYQANSASHESSWMSPFEVEQRNRQIVREEFELYLSEPLIVGEQIGNLDIVQYWVASSVSSERVFSSSKLTITAERNRLSTQNAEYLQVLKHAVRMRRRDLLDGITTDSDGALDFVSRLFDDMNLKDEEKDEPEN